MDFFRGVTFLSSYPSVEGTPVDGLPVVAVTGRSNSGKSTLISTLCNHKKLAHSSKTAGKTRLLNYFTVPEGGENRLYLVDMPGYGFAKMPDSEKKKLRAMVDRFLLECPTLVGVLLILDARRDPGLEEHGVLSYCHEKGIPALLVRSKWDTMNQTNQTRAKNSWKKMGIADISLPVSSTSGDGIDKLLEWIRRQAGILPEK